jgi:hypothetical protein
MGLLALLRAGEAVAPMYDAPLQHYHLLEHRDGVWTLCGDLPSHRLLTDYWSMGLSYACTTPFTIKGHGADLARSLPR